MATTHSLPETTPLRIPVGFGLEHLDADLARPDHAAGLVLFAHGSGSGRKSPRNARVAEALQESGFATLLMDLLTPEEERVDLATAHYRFDIGLLAERLEEATRWLAHHGPTMGLPIGYFGASTGAAAALIAAAELPGRVSAVVSRGGRPDLAGGALPEVKAPTLLIVGGADEIVLKHNQSAYGKLACEKSLVTIPGATHLFEEPRALETVSEAAAHWFARHFKGRNGEEPEQPGDMRS